MDRNRDFFKQCLYGLAAIDVIALIIFYINLSGLSNEELIHGGYGGSLGLLPQYLFLNFLVYASVVTYTKGIFEEQFGQSSQFGKFIDKMLSITMLIAILAFVLRYWP